jgi:hypothetical protein
MRVFLTLPLLAVAMYQQSCDLASMAGAHPDQIEQKVVQAMRPYFPNVQVHVLPEQRTIFAITCAQSIGEPVISQIAEHLERSPQIGKLRQLENWGFVVGAPSYKFLKLGFEDSVVELNVDTGAIQTVATDDQYIASYRRDCSTDVSNDSRRRGSGRYTYIGVFDVQAWDGKKTQTFSVLDSLGVYSPSEFESHLGEEVGARKSIMLAHFRKQKLNVSGVTLRQVEKIAIPVFINQQTLDQPYHEQGNR